MVSGVRNHSTDNPDSQPRPDLVLSGGQCLDSQVHRRFIVWCPSDLLGRYFRDPLRLVPMSARAGGIDCLLVSARVVHGCDSSNQF